VSVHILLVEHDPAIAAFARRVLRAHGARVVVAASGHEAIELLRGKRRWDGVVLAAALADGSGYDACRRLREEGIWTTVLVLVDPDDTLERARESGADGYLRKPFSGAKLLTAVDDVSENAGGGVSAAGLRLHPSRRSVTKRDTEVHLSPIEFALLELLVRHPGEVIDRPRLLEHAWSYDYANGSNVVEVYLGRLREKVDRPFGTQTIQTVRGRGYRLVGDDG
jgi:two-component system, OmpR family, response regulator